MGGICLFQCDPLQQGWDMLVQKWVLPMTWRWLLVKRLLKNIPEVVLKNTALKKQASKNFDALGAQMRKTKEL